MNWVTLRNSPRRFKGGLNPFNGAISRLQNDASLMLQWKTAILAIAVVIHLRDEMA